MASETNANDTGARRRAPTARDPRDAVEAAIRAHDRALDACGLDLWIGAEPTYTARDAETGEWLYEALGADKVARARRMLRRLAAGVHGAAVLRTIGRQYPDEPSPRWSLGLYARRDGVAVWDGPPDPLLAERSTSPAPAPVAFASALAQALTAGGHAVLRRTVDDALPVRLAYGVGHIEVDAELEQDIARPSPHARPVEGADLRDPLVARGVFLVKIGASVDAAEEPAVQALRIELPGLEDVGAFLDLLARIAEAARSLRAGALVLAGYPPPVDRSVQWTTLTPDPAVLEVNLAPSRNGTEFYRRLAEVAAAADAAKLTSYRLHYNGLETDSGGGGQITLGGPSPQESPFLRTPSLLPSLVRYFNRHPALSYLHAPESVGAASQAPRPDEASGESLRELDLALALLDASPRADPTLLWSALAPFLADLSGNTHRAEINIEKLWNPALGTRGRLGLVEFRAFRMPRSAATLAATGALLRAIVAMLAARPLICRLVDWGDGLHDQFSLPFFLRADLARVLDELRAAGFGLAPPLEERVLDDDHRRLASLELPGARLEVSRAVEFWPLIGDVATQERGGSRRVDASTARVELCLRPDPAGGALEGWRASAGDVAVPLRATSDARGPARIAGVRYRAFAAPAGLHPALGAQAPLALTLAHPDRGCWRLTLHEWRADGDAYPGLPASIEEARARRRGRCVLAAVDPAPATPAGEAVHGGGYVVDLRWPPPRKGAPER